MTSNPTQVSTLNHSALTPNERPVKMNRFLQYLFLFSCCKLVLSCVSGGTTNEKPNPEVAVKGVISDGGISNLTDRFDTCYVVTVFDDKVEILRQGAVRDLDFLQVIYINGRGLKYLEQRAFINLPFIRIISLSNNALEVITRGVFKDVPVKEIVLSGNQISLIQDEAFDARELEQIFLERNKLTEFRSSWFKNADNLEYIHLKRNSIRKLSPESFTGFKALKSVDLNHNQLCRLEAGVFPRTKSLTDISLQQNNLRSIDPDVFTDVFVEKGENTFLDLSLNQLMFLHPDVLKNLESGPKMITFDFNPWYCACEEIITKWGVKTGKFHESPRELDLVCVVPKVNQKECPNTIDIDDMKLFLKKFVDVGLEICLDCC